MASEIKIGTLLANRHLGTLRFFRVLNETPTKWVLGGGLECYKKSLKIVGGHGERMEFVTPDMATEQRIINSKTSNILRATNNMRDCIEKIESGIWPIVDRLGPQESLRVEQLSNSIRELIIGKEEVK